MSDFVKTVGKTVENSRWTTIGIVFVVITAIVLTILYLFISPLFKKAHSAEWSKWGVAPYASTLGEACKKSSAAIEGFSIPPYVKDHFKQVVGLYCKGNIEASGSKVWLTPGTHFEEMWSGGPKPHVMRDRTVAELPVLKSSEGHYRKGTVAQTAVAIEWSLMYEGKNYNLFLPLVCHNWAWNYQLPTEKCVSPKEKCKTVKYTVEPGDEVRFAVLSRNRLPSSNCWQLCDGEKCSAPPSPCDDCNWVGPKSVLPIGFEPLHTGKYKANAAEQSLRFPSEVKSEYIALCDKRSGLGESNSWIIPPTKWGNETETVHVPYGGQQWPVWGREKIDMSKWPDRR